MSDRPEDYTAYQADRAVNFSTMKVLHKGSPKHYRHAVESQDTGDTTSRGMLRLIHALVLEPHHVARDFATSDLRSDVRERRTALVTGPEPEAGTVDWIAWCIANDNAVEYVVCDARSNSKERKGIVEAGGIPMKSKDVAAAEKLAGELSEALATVGRTVVSSTNRAHAEAVAEAVRADPVAAAVLAAPGALFESRLSWVDEASGLPCKGFADIIIPEWDTDTILDGFSADVRDQFRHMDGHVVVIDLKTLGTAKPSEVVRFAHKNLYPVQGAHYGRGALAKLGQEPDGVFFFGILAVEDKAPHDVSLTFLGEDHMTAAGIVRDGWLATIAECRRTGEYPGHATTPTMATADDWMVRDYDPDAFDDAGIVITELDA